MHVLQTITSLQGVKGEWVPVIMHFQHVYGHLRKMNLMGVSAPDTTGGYNLA